MIVITGGAGFIGYNLVKRLIELGYRDIVVVDDNIGRLVSKGYQDIKYLSVEDSFLWLSFQAPSIDFVFHLGAITDTTETDKDKMFYYNLNYSKFIWTFCTEEKIPLIYASSAAVYGNGDFGFSDVGLFVDEWDYFPMNLYGETKFWFDDWVVEEVIDGKKTPPFWAGLRFFNVYGQHEGHKGNMASVVFQFYNQIKETGEAKLFKSHVIDCGDGNQERDFIYVDDVIDICLHLMNEKPPSDIYNVGTGKYRSYNDLARAVFKYLGKEEKISYIDIPTNIRDRYQYFTRAEISKLRTVGKYKKGFHELEEGIAKYIKLLENENC